MHDRSDQELLRRYADDGAEEAFTELVRRHCNLVWAAARRVSGDGDLARDVAQTVFTDLARKAKRLPAGTALAGWLYRAACHAACKQVRAEARRTHREQVSMPPNELSSAPSAETRAAEDLQTALDAALAALPELDRDAVVLRFLAGRSFAEVGAALGTTDDAAQKRVSRALEKLRDAFRHRGMAVHGGLVAAALSLAGAEAAPAGLAAAVAGNALAGASGATGGIISYLTLMKTKLAFGMVAGAAAVGTLAWQQQRIVRLTDENTALRQQVAAISRPAEVAPPSVDLAELERLREGHAELLRLRGEVARLRQAAAPAANQRLQDAESRVAQAEAQTAAIRAEVAFRTHRVQIIQTGKALGLAARVFSNDHDGQFPTTFDEMQAGLNYVEKENYLSDRSLLDRFEFFPQPRAIHDSESQRILFREREPRPIPPAALSEEEAAGFGPESMQPGWERAYVMADGSVQSPRSAHGDFSQAEREGTAGPPPEVARP